MNLNAIHAANSSGTRQGWGKLGGKEGEAKGILLNSFVYFPDILRIKICSKSMKIL